ncbi:hypothetical protein [Flammeovirga sp. SubArs3]|uniref:hypothetical protein n=1 Tax=Flammeovirga sp. SubArs3 TaxID=2995316 RepID=UPI00248C7E3E|nr:hypothetical protein [Flammeovirga sp. SubArs3]
MGRKYLYVTFEITYTDGTVKEKEDEFTGSKADEKADDAINEMELDSEIESVKIIRTYYHGDW